MNLLMVCVQAGFCQIWSHMCHLADYPHLAMVQRIENSCYMVFKKLDNPGLQPIVLELLQQIWKVLHSPIDLLDPQ